MVMSAGCTSFAFADVVFLYSLIDSCVPVLSRMVFADLQKNTFTACACLVLMKPVLCAPDNVSKQSTELFN